MPNRRQMDRCRTDPGRGSTYDLIAFDPTPPPVFPQPNETKNVRRKMARIDARNKGLTEIRPLDKGGKSSRTEAADAYFCTKNSDIDGAVAAVAASPGGFAKLSASMIVRSML